MLGFCMAYVLAAEGTEELKALSRIACRRSPNWQKSGGQTDQAIADEPSED